MSRENQSGEQMSFALFHDDDVRKSWAIRAERRVAASDNLKPRAARQTLARRWGLSFWTLTNWHSGRLKRMAGEVRDRIDAGIIRELEHQIQSLTHELELAIQSGSNAGSDKVLAIRSQIARLSELLIEAGFHND